MRRRCVRKWAATAPSKPAGGAFSWSTIAWRIVNSRSLALSSLDAFESSRPSYPGSLTIGYFYKIWFWIPISTW